MKYLYLILIICCAFIFTECTVENNNVSVEGCQKPNGNSETVKICNQIWMKKNLDVDHYRNGDLIPEVRDADEWGGLTTGAWCYYNNDPAMGAIYGKLYNWYAVNDPRGLAPKGWHVPSDAEWTELENCLGGSYEAGGKMKETGTAHWNYPNLGATNESGFTALGSGWRSNNGTYDNIYLCFHLWTSSEYDLVTPWFRSLHFDGTKVTKDNYYEKENGFSVRCVRD